MSYHTIQANIGSRLTAVVALLLCFGTVLQLWGISIAEAKGVHVTVAAPWTETPFLQEGCEWAAVRESNRDGFYECLQDVWHHVGALNNNNNNHNNNNNSISSIAGGALTLTQKSQYEMLFDIMERKNRSSYQMALLKMKLAARVYSPAVEAHWALARIAMRLADGCSIEGKPFVMIFGNAICNEHTLEKMLKDLSLSYSKDTNKRENNKEVEKETMMLFPKLDHIHPESKGQHVVILYGLVGEQQTMRLFKIIQSYLHIVRFAFRHLPVTGGMWENPLFVQGYGVTVDLKNVEYKVMDKKSSETETEQQENKSEGEGRDIEPVGGFDLNILKRRYPNLTKQLNSFGDYLAEMIDREEVKVDFHMWETQHMGGAAVKQVMNAAKEERLNVLLNILTNFPLHASKLSKMGSATGGAIDGEMQQVMMQLLSLVQAGSSLAFLNGQRINTPEMDLFSILEKIEAEDKLLESLTQILTSYHLPSPETDNGFLSVESTKMTGLLNDITETVQNRIALKGLDLKRATTRIWFPQKSILWINDIEKDSNYEHLSLDLNTIFETSYSGIPQIPKRNLLNIVGIVDPTTPEGHQAIITLMKIVAQGQPLRAGIVIVNPHWLPEIHVSIDKKEDDVEIPEKSSPSKAIMMIAATLWELLRENTGNAREAIQFMVYLREYVINGQTISDSDINVVAESILSMANKRSLLEIMGDKDFNKYYHETQETIYNLHFKEFPTILINGNMFSGDVLAALEKGLMMELSHIRDLVGEEKIKNTDVDMYESIMESSGAIHRYFRDLYEDQVYVNWASKSIIDFLQYRSFLFPLSNTKEVPLLSTVLRVQAPLKSRDLQAILKITEELYECKDRSEKCRFIRHTFAICGMLKDNKRRTLAVDLERLLINENINGNNKDGSRRLEFMREFLLKVIPKSDKIDMNNPDVYEKFLSTVHFSSDMEKVLANTSPKSDILLKEEEQEKLVDGFCKDMRNSHTLLTGEVEDIKSIYYYVNGRRFTYSDDYTLKDLEDAALRELSFAEIVGEVIKDIHFEKIHTYLQKNKPNNAFYASKISAVSALLKEYYIRVDLPKEYQHLPPAPGPISFVVNPISGKQPRHRFTIILDPISQKSQLLVSLCDYIVHSPIDASCTVYLNPSQHSGKPMRNFYQFVGDVNVNFDNTGRVIPPAAIFRRLPSKHLLTLGVVEPEGWTVFPMKAQYDLDNIILSSLPQASQYLYAIYRINSILITGSAKESGGSTPPRGLPLLIRSLRNNTNTNRNSVNSANSNSGSLTRDTLVMANLGYFQLQSTPGVWYLTVQPGAFAKSFYISKVKGVRTNYVEKIEYNGVFNFSKGQSIPIVVSSFTGEFIKLEVAKVPGEGNVQIGDLVEASAIHMEWPPRGPQKTRPVRPTLNIFSVASGHLYERFLRMMIHSVMKTSSDVHGANTTRIKFWLIENFLSPQFKELVPLLAEHYGFDVGFVTYRWPWWLNKQTEKQRTIWAYKILFLDVLFPLEVERIIFVDADQTVQADLHELYNMNIGNAPTAYTPFCRKHPNEATKNFRFWDQGFWLRHLNGKPYHISAIYLVDVRRLRAIAGGDKYRLMYSQLSRDPNSLANLDQDLPNFMQEEVPIYSLPEEWLWCETWCGAESKAQAKTIDLCNNPLTKIPKLENAKLIIKGWEEMDAELETLSEKLRQEHHAKQQRK
ncbi:UDP-glucose:glycoprotein glucosyltransferase [Trypanosoma theileri]|uniref:UDP-glucose:glycoprotein glucosyltransferase n=1 Tax=Trypanosoma theileri TaxID=67003 RepID=A0A1X0P0A1_9TRYP|nr:UDP-glucose:glycoprotein glucosyltransferase [Trypanosoma theileri]ORC90281.1 UDP-glucose:glycoprotein glucosyltransferase [Trypanosoma theileri]